MLHKSFIFTSTLKNSNRQHVAFKKMNKTRFPINSPNLTLTLIVSMQGANDPEATHTA